MPAHLEGSRNLPRHKYGVAMNNYSSMPGLACRTAPYTRSASYLDSTPTGPSSKNNSRGTSLGQYNGTVTNLWSHYSRIIRIEPQNRISAFVTLRRASGDISRKEGIDQIVDVHAATTRNRFRLLIQRRPITHNGHNTPPFQCFALILTNIP